jgi:hypothetical protein
VKSVKATSVLVWRSYRWTPPLARLKASWPAHAITHTVGVLPPPSQPVSQRGASLYGC